MTERADSEAPDEQAERIPPRYRWLKRLTILFLVLFVAMAGVRWWWGHHAEQRFQTWLTSARDAGERLFPEDLAAEYGPLPDDANGAYFLKLAVESMTTWPDDMPTSSALLADRQARRDQRQQIAQYVSANQGASALVRMARAQSRADWDVQLTSPMIAVLLPHLATQRELARLTALAALHYHEEGNGAEAVAMLHDLMAIARHVGDGQPFVIGYLVACAIDSLATRTVESCVADLQIADPTAALPGEQRPATRDDVRALIAELLDEQNPREGLQLAFDSERMLELDAAMMLMRGQVGMASLGTGSPRGPLDSLRAAALAPAWKLDAIRMLEHTGQYARAGQAPNWPTARSQMPPPPTAVGPTTPWRVVHMLSSILQCSLGGVLRQHYTTLASRRMAATALAYRLYTIDHGHPPGALSDLVPGYLPAIPRDPFDAADGPIRFNPNAQQPVLYSVGADATDSDGQYRLDSRGNIDRDSGDLPLFLDGDRPHTPPDSQPATAPSTMASSTPASTQAVVDDQQIEEAAGDEKDQQ